MHIRRILSVTAPLLCTALLIGCGGGTRQVSIPAWQKNVEQYVKQQGRGDPAVLRDVTLADSRRGFAMIGADHPAESSDANGVLVGVRDVQGRPWFIYLVGLVKSQQVREIRAAALAADSAGKMTWKLGPGDTAALQAYRGYNDSLWKQRFPTRGSAPPEYLGFPRAEDNFQLKVSGDQITITHVASGARWELNLPAARRG